MEFEFKEVRTEKDFFAVFPLMKQLRPHLTEHSFKDIAERARNEGGYSMLGVYHGPTCIGLMGARVLTDFVHGRHLYIDDLVVDKDWRSQGIGALLFDQARDIAKRESCNRLRLCTGIENDRARKFYEKNGWDFQAVVFKTRI